MRTKRASWCKRAVGVLLAAVLVSACGDDDDGGTPPVPYSELLFVSDVYTLRTVEASSAGFRDVGSATIPGVPGTYERAGNAVTVTMDEHELFDGFWVELTFAAGTGGTATSGLYPVTVVDGDSFTITDTAAGTITGGKVVRKPVTARTGTYSQAGTTVTITLTNHGLVPSDDLKLDFTSGAAVDAVTDLETVVDANTFTVVAAAAATTSGNVTVLVGANYAIFGMAMHPSGRWVYTSSTYECWSGEPLCWGSGLLSRFAIDWNDGQVTFEEAVSAGRSGAAPVGLAFSPDGALLFNQDDDLDGVDMWSVDPTNGHLQLLASTASRQASLHGLAVSADGTRVYNGPNVYSFVTGGTPSITRINTEVGVGSNSCTIVNGTLFSAARASGTWQLRTYSLANADVPAQVATVSTNAENQAREIVVSPTGGLVVTAGFAGLKAYTYAAGVLAPATGPGKEYIDGGLAAWPDSSSVRKMFRSLTVNEAGNLLAAAYFTNDPDSSTFGGLPPAGVMLFSLAADGTMARVADSDAGTYNRVARFYSKP